MFTRGTAIRTFVRTKYTPTSFQSQAALFAEFAEVGQTAVGGIIRGLCPYISANLRITSCLPVIRPKYALATNPTKAGEATALYRSEQLQALE
jgi:hypothetical protein